MQQQDKNARRDANRQAIQEQVEELLDKAAMRPGKEDPLGLVSFMSTLLAAQMQTHLLVAEKDEMKRE